MSREFVFKTKASFYSQSYVCVEYVYTNDVQIKIPILNPHRVLNDLNLAMHQEQQELLGIEFFQLFPLDQWGSHQIESVQMVYDILCRNSQDGNGQELYTYDQVFYEVKKMERCLIIQRFFLAFMVFSLRCFLKDKHESSTRPKCFCSFILATTVPLNIICGWFVLDFSEENKTSVACLVRSGLNSNFH